MRPYKNNIKRAGLIVLLIGFALPLFAAGTSVIYDKPVTVREAKSGGTWVEYSGTAATVIASTDSIGTHYTQAMYIKEFNQENAYWRAVMSNSARGTEDCNVTVQYSDDRTTWVTGNKIKDQLTTTAIADTLNVQAKVGDVYFRTYQWMRLKLEYQAGNPYLTTLTWSIYLQKPATLSNKMATAANKL